MRFTYALVLALAVAGGVFWLRHDPSNRPLHASANAQSAVPAAPPMVPPSRTKDAANAIRSTSVAPVVGATAPKNDTTSKASLAAAAQAAASAPTAIPATVVTPAAELFSGFVDDDPRNVFLPSSVQYHAAVDAEAVDPAWGPAAAAALRNAISARYGDRFEMPLVDCRQDLCELRVAGRIGGDQLADMQDFQQLVSMMKAEPWWSALEFDQETGMIGTAPDGRALLLYFFSRR